MHFATLLDKLGGSRFVIIGEFCEATNMDEWTADVFAAFMRLHPYVVRYLRRVHDLPDDENEYRVLMPRPAMQANQEGVDAAIAPMAHPAPMPQAKWWASRNEGIGMQL